MTHEKGLDSYAFLLSNSNADDEVDSLPEKLRYSNLDLLCTVTSIVTYLFDLAMDCVVAYYFYYWGVTHGIYWYCGLTVTFILLPSFTMTGFSFRWYLMDADNDSMDPVPVWRWCLRLIVLFLQIAPILRYVDSMIYGILSRRAAYRQRSSTDPIVRARNSQDRKRYYTLMIYEDADATLLRLFECFMESAPQLVLQIYILIQDPRASRFTDDSDVSSNDVIIIKSSILGVSIVSSLVSLAWSLVIYHRSLRHTFPDKNNISFVGSVFQFLWHFASITARVLALSLFASIYPTYIGPVCAAHWIIMSSWVIFQRTEACRTPCEEFLFSIVLGAIYIFSFFNAKEEKTRVKYLIYYGFCFLENSALIGIWFRRVDPENWYYYPGIAGHYFAFFGGILFMILYYVFFHPTGVDLSFLRKMNDKKPPLQAATTSIHVTAFSNNDNVERPLSRTSRCLSSPTLEDINTKFAMKNGVRRSASAPSSRPPLYYLEARRLKDMAGRYRT